MVGKPAKKRLSGITSFTLPTVLVLQVLFAGLSYGDGLIPPTRTLEGDERSWGRLTVFSEPPGLEVYLDGEKVGAAPLWLSMVEAGTHILRVGDTEEQVLVQPGKRTKAGVFKGSFIAMTEEDRQVLPEPPAAKGPLPEGPVVERPEEEERRRELTRWDLFINGSLPFF